MSNSSIGRQRGWSFALNATRKQDSDDAKKRMSLRSISPSSTSPTRNSSVFSLFSWSSTPSAADERDRTQTLMSSSSNESSNSDDDNQKLSRSQITAKRFIIKKYIDENLFPELRQSPSKLNAPAVDWNELSELLCEIAMHGKTDNFNEFLWQLSAIFDVKKLSPELQQKLAFFFDSSKHQNFITIIKNIFLQKGPYSFPQIKTDIKQCLDNALKKWSEYKDWNCADQNLLQNFQDLHPTLTTFQIDENSKVVKQSLFDFLQENSTNNELLKNTTIQTQNKNGELVEMSIADHRALTKSKFYSLLELDPTSATPSIIILENETPFLNPTVALALAKKVADDNLYSDIDLMQRFCTTLIPTLFP
ncbi:MAG: hypothetical protein V4591_03900, partial [Bdellovibrionota bacterium]